MMIDFKTGFQIGKNAKIFKTGDIFNGEKLSTIDIDYLIASNVLEYGYYTNIGDEKSWKLTAFDIHQIMTNGVLVDAHTDVVRTLEDLHFKLIVV